MTEGNMFRQFWEAVVVVLLVYIATLFLYGLCFMEFKIPEREKPKDFWKVANQVVNVLFWIDLFINFFISYRDSREREIKSLPRVARHYLRTYFFINVVSCTPPQLIRYLVSFQSTSDGEIRFHEAARVVRLQKVSNLIRLMNLARLAKLVGYVFSALHRSELWEKLKGNRPVRVMNYIFGLGFACHILACGWYLVAALHSDPLETWVARRSVGSTADEKVLLHGSSWDHYTHAIYFVLTVFTTVGFGDISSQSNIEIWYVMFVMLVGAVVNSIIISEVISIINTSDQKMIFIEEQQKLMESYSLHTKMDPQVWRTINHYLYVNAADWMTHRFDRSEMRNMIMGRYLPRSILADIPHKVFDGQLMLNKLLQPQVTQLLVAPRLPLLLALYLQSAEFLAKEVVYERSDNAFNMFLVLKGCFAFVGKATKDGGLDDQIIYNDETTTYNDEIVRPRSRKFSEHSQNSSPLAHAPTRLFVLSESSRAKTSCTEGTLETEMYPYRLFGPRSYFGEVEMLQHRARDCTAQCQSEVGQALVLHQTDFKDICESFPQFARAWVAEAKRREEFRLKMLSRLLVGCDFTAMAARQIQECWRARSGTGGRSAQSSQESAVQGASGGVSVVVPVATSMAVPPGAQEHGTCASPRGAMLSQVSVAGGDFATRGQVDALAKGMSRLESMIISLAKEVRSIRADPAGGEKAAQTCASI